MYVNLSEQYIYCVCSFLLVDGAICVYKGLHEGKRVGGWWGLGGVDGGAAMISLKVIRILLFHYNSNHQEPPDEIFIRDLRIQAF